MTKAELIAENQRLQNTLIRCKSAYDELLKDIRKRDEQEKSRYEKPFYLEKRRKFYQVEYRSIKGYRALCQELADKGEPEFLAQAQLIGYLTTSLQTAEHRLEKARKEYAKLTGVYDSCFPYMSREDLDNAWLMCNEKKAEKPQPDKKEVNSQLNTVDDDLLSFFERSSKSI